MLTAGRLHFICRVPGLEGISNFGQVLLLPGQNLPRRCRTLSGLHQAGGEGWKSRSSWQLWSVTFLELTPALPCFAAAVRAGTSGCGAEHPHHRASGFPHCPRGEGGSRRVWWPQVRTVSPCLVPSLLLLCPQSGSDSLGPPQGHLTLAGLM